MAVIIYVSESATPAIRGKNTAKTHPPCPLAAARGSFLSADPAGHGGCRLCRLAGHRIGQYAHLQQCARLVILALILGVRRGTRAQRSTNPVTLCDGYGAVGTGIGQIQMAAETIGAPAAKRGRTTWTARADA
jgi:hypothetical protein